MKLKLQNLAVKFQSLESKCTMKKMNCLLELAEDVSVFCRDAGGLQDSHPEGKDVTDPQVLQGCVKRAVQTGLQWNLQLIRTSCEERKTTVKHRLKLAFQVDGQVELIVSTLDNVWLSFRAPTLSDLGQASLAPCFGPVSTVI